MVTGCYTCVLLQSERCCGRNKQHEECASDPPNPLLANAFFRASYIEFWGRGIEKIRRECQDQDIELPVYDFEMSGLMLNFLANPAHLPAQSRTVDAGEKSVKTISTGKVRCLLYVIKGEMERQQLQSALRLKQEDHFRETYLIPTLKLGLVEMTIPDKPRSSRQKYRLTTQGVAVKASKHNG